MHRGHKPLHNAEIVVDYLCQRRETVGRAACVADDFGFGLAIEVVYSHYVHGSVRTGRSYDNLFRAARQVSARLFHSGELSCRFGDHIDFFLPPFYRGRLRFVENADSFTVDDKISVVDVYIGVKLPVNGVVF